MLWLDGSDAVVAAVTSASPRSQTDVPLQEWQKAGLRLPSVVRLSRLDCLEQTLLIARLGVLTKTDASTLKRVWSRHITPQF